MAQNQAAYKFSLFEPYDYGTAAPQLEPVYAPERVPAKKPVPAVKKKKAPSVTAAQKSATKASFLSTVKIVSLVVAVFSVFSVAMFLNVRLDETATQISSIESDIKVAKSENIRLASALEGMVSIDKIEDYAENNLGMVKLENYKITYFENDASEQVVISGGKSYANKDLQ